MGLTSQHLQTGVHCQLALLGLTMEIPQKDSGSIIDVDYNTLRAMTADLDNDWPLKSVQAHHHSPASAGDEPLPALMSQSKFRSASGAKRDRSPGDHDLRSLSCLLVWDEVRCKIQ